MLDKVYYNSKYQVTLIFTHRGPVTLWSGEGKILEFLDMFLAPMNGEFNNECKTLSEYHRLLKSSEEDTMIINLDEVA